MPYHPQGKFQSRTPVCISRANVAERRSSSDHSSDGISESMFLSSRDGLRFERTFKEAWIRLGPVPRQLQRLQLSIRVGSAETPPSSFRACRLFRWGPRNHAPPTQGKTSRTELFNRGDRLRFSRNPDTRQAERFQSSPWSGLRTASATESKRPPDGDTEATSRSWDGCACGFASVRRIVFCTWTGLGSSAGGQGLPRELFAAHRSHACIRKP